MLPGVIPPGFMWAKFEKKKAFWLAIQVGPSTQLTPLAFKS
jgi:hypothetical protein